jgi:hypothetical protein
VKEALARTGTLYMVADSTKFNADIDDDERPGSGQLPLYVVYPAANRKFLPQVLTPSIVVNALTQAAVKRHEAVIRRDMEKYEATREQWPQLMALAQAAIRRPTRSC